MKTPQQIADQLNSLRAQAVSIVEGTIAGAANPGGSITFTYTNPIDGQPYTATGTAWNQCVPSKVSALKQTDGTWIVVGQHESAIVREAVHTDRRARPQPETGGKIKILYSVTSGSDQVFYVGGDRATPKEVGRIPASSNEEIYQINNRGKGFNQFIVGLRWQDAANAFSTRSLGEVVWDYLNEPKDPLSYSRNDFYAGHGFWAFNSTVPGYSGLDSLLSQVQPINYSIFDGIRKDSAASLTANSVDSDGSVASSTYTASRDLAPTFSKTEQGFSIRLNVFTAMYFNPVIVSKDLASAVYLSRSISGYVAAAASYVIARTGSASEIVLGGTIPTLSREWIAGNLISDRLYVVTIPFSTPSDKQWSVDVYQLGSNSTKKTIKTSVTYTHKSNYLIHSASYHP